MALILITRGVFRVFIRLTSFVSIREFCEPDTPIIMFDEDGAYVVMRLEQVCESFFVMSTNLGDTHLMLYSYFHYPLAQKLFPNQAHYPREAERGTIRA